MYTSDNLLVWDSRYPALVKRYGICISVRKLCIYLKAEVLFSDHKPLQKFLKGMTGNKKVHRWSFELSGNNNIFEWIPGVPNILVDTVSRLVKLV